MSNIYEIAVFLIGDLPTQYHFIYAFMTIALSIVFVVVVFMPFIIGFRLIKWR